MRALGPPTGPPDSPEEHPRAPEVDKRRPRFYYNKTNIFAKGGGQGQCVDSLRGSTCDPSCLPLLLLALFWFVAGVAGPIQAPPKAPQDTPRRIPPRYALRIAPPGDRRPRMGRERPLLATHRFWFAVFQCLMLSVLALASYQPLFLNLYFCLMLSDLGDPPGPPPQGQQWLG